MEGQKIRELSKNTQGRAECPPHNSKHTQGRAECPPHNSKHTQGRAECPPHKIYGRAFVAIALLFSLSNIAPAFAETAYQRWLRMAVAARNRGNYDAALTYYQRAADVSPNGPNDSDINTAIFQVLEARLQSLQTTAPNYVRYIRIADEAYFNGEYDRAIQNYRRALRERPSDRYATLRIQQAECIKNKRPATGAQFRTMCPGF